MSAGLYGHTPERAAAIIAAGKAAGMIDPTDALTLIPPEALVNPADGVANLLATRPHLFKPPATQMSAADYAISKQTAVRESEAQRRHADLVKITQRISEQQQSKGN